MPRSSRVQLITWPVTTSRPARALPVAGKSAGGGLRYPVADEPFHGTVGRQPQRRARGVSARSWSAEATRAASPTVAAAASARPSARSCRAAAQRSPWRRRRPTGEGALGAQAGAPAGEPVAEEAGHSGRADARGERLQPGPPARGADDHHRHGHAEGGAQRSRREPRGPAAPGQRRRAAQARRPSGRSVSSGPCRPGRVSGRTSLAGLRRRRARPSRQRDERPGSGQRQGAPGQAEASGTVASLAAMRALAAPRWSPPRRRWPDAGSGARRSQSSRPTSASRRRRSGSTPSTARASSRWPTTRRARWC